MNVAWNSRQVISRTVHNGGPVSSGSIFSLLHCLLRHSAVYHFCHKRMVSWRALSSDPTSCHSPPSPTQYSWVVRASTLNAAPVSHRIYFNFPLLRPLNKSTKWSGRTMWNEWGRACLVRWEQNKRGLELGKLSLRNRITLRSNSSGHTSSRQSLAGHVMLNSKGLLGCTSLNHLPWDTGSLGCTQDYPLFERYTCIGSRRIMLLVLQKWPGEENSLQGWECKPQCYQNIQPTAVAQERQRRVRPQTLIDSLATVVQLVGCLGPSLFSLLTAAVSP